MVPSSVVPGEARMFVGVVHKTIRLIGRLYLSAEEP
jgi:hypothetical protein